MPNILPNAQFQFLADQRNKEFASSQQNQQVMQDNFKRAALTNQFNQAYKQYEQDKDVNKFEQNVRSLGMTYGNDKMASFKAQESSSMKPMYEYDEATGKTRHLGDVPKGAVVKTKPKQGINIQELKYYDAQKEKDQTNQKKTEMILGGAQDTLNTIGEIEKDLKYFGAAGAIGAFPFEYDKKNWKANLEKLKSRLVLDVMSEMKNASRTGATGFGQLSEKEMKVLQDASTALKETLSEDDAQRYINIIKEKAQKVLGDNQMGIAPQASQMPQQGQMQGQSQAQGVVMEDASGNRALVDPQTGQVIREL